MGDGGRFNQPTQGKGVEENAMRDPEASRTLIQHTDSGPLDRAGEPNNGTDEIPLPYGRWSKNQAHVVNASEATEEVGEAIPADVEGNQVGDDVR